MSEDFATIGMSLRNALAAPNAVRQGLTLSQSEFTWLPIRELSSLSDLAISVIPVSMENQPLSRAVVTHDYTYHIGLRQRVKADDTTAVSSLVSLSSEVLQWTEGLHIGTAQWVRSSMPAIADPDDLREKRLFFSVIEVVLRFWSKR